MIKRDIHKDFIECQEALRELGFTTTNGGFMWMYELLNIYISPITYHIYDENLCRNVDAPHIMLSYEYNSGEKVDVQITQHSSSIIRSILSNSLTDLGIKALNRNIKMYCLLNGIDYEGTKAGTISCMALKLKPDLYSLFWK